MKSTKEIRREVIKNLLTRFPDAPALTLAKKLYKEHNELFNSVDHARSNLRVQIGTNGDRHRKNTKDKEFFRAPRKAGEIPLPKGMQHFRKWGPRRITGEQGVLILSDIHVPYHDTEALETALKVGDKRKPKTILLNGDTLDFYSLSRWEKDPRKRKFKQELDTSKQFLEHLRQRFPKARIVFKEGNHEERYYKYMLQKAPELLDDSFFSFQDRLGFDRLGIEFLGNKQPTLLGKLHVIHGHEYTFAISNPVNPARGLFLRAKVSTMTSHFHQTSQHSEKRLDGHIVSCFSTGCLCDLRPDYMPLNNHNHGFAFVEIGRGGSFEVDNFRIIDGQPYT